MPGNPVLEFQHPGGQGVGGTEDHPLGKQVLLLKNFPVGQRMLPGQDTAQGELIESLKGHPLFCRQIFLKTAQDLDLPLKKQIQQRAVGQDPEQRVKGHNLLPACLQYASQQLQCHLTGTADGQGLHMGIGVVAQLGSGNF